MESSMLSLIISALVLIGMGIVGVQITIVNGRSKRIQEKTEEVYHLVNSAKSHMEREVKRLQERIEALGGEAAPDETPDELGERLARK